MFGLINILPKYQRTHLNTHAMSLILGFMFDHLELVRVQYDAVTFNEASIRAAQRFGFKAEGIGRNMLGLVPDGKKREGERLMKSQDLWMSSMTDYEWEKGGRDRLKQMLERPVVDTSAF
jgi:RimJ/RimL family protein N-acetyltransferase